MKKLFQKLIDFIEPVWRRVLVIFAYIAIKLSGK